MGALTHIERIRPYLARNHWLILIPITLVLFPYQVPPFQPVQVIYAGTILPLLLAPFTLPWTVGALLGRVMQFAIISKWFPMDTATLYAANLSIIPLRVAVGWIFNRGVGWKYPFLFIHSAG